MSEELKPQAQAAAVTTAENAYLEEIKKIENPSFSVIPRLRSSRGNPFLIWNWGYAPGNDMALDVV